METVHLDFAPLDDGDGRKKKVKKPPRVAIPVVPDRPAPLSGAEIRRGVSDRARSAANLKVEGYSYLEIADMLELHSADEARRMVESVLASIHGPGDLETLRLVVAARAENLFKQSMAMASADFLVDAETRERLPNPDRARWHQQASVDLMNYATITGAKAPSKVEVTPGEADYDKLVDMIASRMGYSPLREADVLELEVLPDIDDEEDD